MFCIFIIALLTAVVTGFLIVQILTVEMNKLGYDISVLKPVTPKQKLMVIGLFWVLALASPLIIVILLNADLRATARTVFVEKFMTTFKENI